MPCDSFIDRLLEYQEEQLDPTARAVVEAHLAGCSECRDFLRDLRDVDAVLSGQPVPRLSAGFGERLAQRVREADPELLIARKRQLEAEYKQGLARLRTSPQRWEASLGPVALVAAGVVGLLMLWQIFLGSAPSWGIFEPMRAGQLGSWPVAIALLAVFGGILTAFPQGLRRLGSAIA